MATRFSIQPYQTPRTLVSAPVSRTSQRSAPARPSASGGPIQRAASAVKGVASGIFGAVPSGSLTGNIGSNVSFGGGSSGGFGGGGSSGGGSAPRSFGGGGGSSAPAPQPVPQGPTEEQITKEMVANEILKQAQDFLEQLKARGQTVNPYVDITPEKVLEFSAQAEKELGPYYAEQLKLAREEFLTDLGYAKEDIERTEQELERKYGLQVRQLSEELAETGFAQSGRRLFQERQLSEEAQRNIEQKRREAAERLGLKASEFTKEFGSEALKDANVPQIGPSPRALPGEFSFERLPGETRPLYTLSPSVYGGITGAKEFEKRGALRDRGSQLEEAYRTKKAVEQQRTLTL